MSDKDLENHLRSVLMRLEKTTREIVKTRGYGQEARSMKMLEEMIREQVTNGSTRRSTRAIR